MEQCALSLKDVKKCFGKNTVLNSINLEVQHGTIIGLVGKNGAGKSTLIKNILGIIKPDDGDLSVFGEPSWDLSPSVKERIGYVPQVLTGFRWMKVDSLIEYTAAFYKKWDMDKVNNLLSEWNLDKWAKIGALSEGERQKLSIILAIGHDPDLYIFDEPVASLDPSARRAFIRQLIELNKDENKTMLFSTHIMSDLERIASEIALLKNGEIVYKGDIADLKESIRKIYIRSENILPGKLPFENILSHTADKKSATIITDGMSDEEIRRCADEISARVTIHRLDLEEIFMELNV